MRAAALSLSLGLAACAQIGTPAGRIIAIESASYASIAEVAAGLAVRARTVEARLIEPSSPAEPDGRPAVVLIEAHGVPPGASPVPALLAEGYAVARLESYRPRGIARFAGGVRRVRDVPDATLVADAFGAYSRLRAEPGIDPTRIALLGLGEGAPPALYASFPGVQLMYQAEWPGYAAHVSLDPRCSLTLARAGSPRVPVLVTGTGPSVPCRDVMPRAPMPPLYRPAASAGAPPGILRLQLPLPSQSAGCDHLVEVAERFSAPRHRDCAEPGPRTLRGRDALVAATAFLRLTIGAQALSGSKLAESAPPASAVSRLASQPARLRLE